MMKGCYFSIALSSLLSNHLPCGAVLGNKHGGHETIESLKDEGSLLLFFHSFVILVVKSFTLWSSSGGTNMEFMKLLKVSRMKGLRCYFSVALSSLLSNHLPMIWVLLKCLGVVVQPLESFLWTNSAVCQWRVYFSAGNNQVQSASHWLTWSQQRQRNNSAKKIERIQSWSDNFQYYPHQPLVEKGIEPSNFFTSFTHFSLKHLNLFCWNSPTIFVKKPVSFQDFSPPSLSRNICSSSLLVAGSFPVCFQFPHPVARKAFLRSRNVESAGDKNIHT